MASKAGRVQFKDLKAGKVFWLVHATSELSQGIMSGFKPVSASREPMRLTIVGKPFRTEVEDDLGRRVPEWTFTASRYYAEYSGAKQVYLDCNNTGIVTEFFRRTVRPTVNAMFTTRKAALRYIERMNTLNYRIAFEHPMLWTKTGLLKRVSTDWQGKRTVYADIRSRTNRHRPWLHTAPLETLIGGVVVGPRTPKEHVLYFLEQSRNELSQMYPHVIEPLSLDSKVTAVELTHVTIGNGDKIHSHYGADRHLRALHQSTVIVPKAAVEDPDRRATLEQDFLIIENSPLPKDDDVGKKEE